MQTTTMNACAAAILQQLGGAQFVAMTGARDFVQSEDSLRFRIPRASRGVTKVIVTLDRSDTYRVTFGRMLRGGDFAKVGEVEGVYAHSLAAIFTHWTMLQTRL